jgi:hypothetical protein
MDPLYFCLTEQLDSIVEPVVLVHNEQTTKFMQFLVLFLLFSDS